jgi:hypothetical protein
VDTQAGIKKARGTRRSKVTGVVGLKLFTGEVFFGLLDHMWVKTNYIKLIEVTLAIKLNFDPVISVSRYSGISP